MNKQSSRKAIVAISMAAALGIGAGVFALLHHSPVAVAPAALPPPDAIAQAPVAAPAIADAPPEVVAEPARPVIAAAVQQTATPAVASPRVASGRIAKASPHTEDTYSAASRASAVVEPAAEAAPSHVIEQVATVPAGVAPASVDVQEPPAGVLTNSPAVPADAVVLDSSITAAVKSHLATDVATQDYEVGVTTLLGVVSLTGTLVSQDAINHVRTVAAGVKDVKSVDTSAMKSTSG